MRAVVQRVSQAHVRVGEREVGRIGSGLLVLVAATHGDGPADAAWLVDKLANLRIFEDDSGKMNRSLLDSGGAALVVSQFTLYGDTRRGRRPSFVGAAAPELAAGLIEQVVAGLGASGIPTATGRFGAHMMVALENDGPVTLILDSPVRAAAGE
ncbi:MAG TPA: D-aminoacyl-tRNA deacylase [Chloroflexota bacterium]|nr:D-aminoacyl-tRNA deacylase [Chloroflexota bacterium]